MDKDSSAVERALNILENLSLNQNRGLRFVEIVSNLELPKSTTHKILRILVSTGYVILDSETRRYRCSLKLARLGAQVVENLDLRNVVHPFLLELAKKTEHTCQAAVLSGNHGVHIDKTESAQDGLKLASRIGKSFELHCTAMGKLFLANMDPVERARKLGEKLQAYTEHTITDHEELDAELAETAACGYARDREERTRGVMCVAAPIRDFENKVVAAIAVVFPSYLDSPELWQEQTRLVMECSRSVSAVLGAQASRVPSAITG